MSTTGEPVAVGLGDGPEPLDDGSERRRFVVDVVVAVVIAACVLFALVGTSHDYGIVWDEGHTIRREEALQHWFTFLANPPVARSRWEAFSPAMLERDWPFGREEPDGHPPFYALLGLAGWTLTRDAFSPLTAYRFGPMVLAAFTTGAVYFHLARRRGRLAGITAAIALIVMPRTFAHAHYAHYDMPMTCLWLLAQMAFVRALDAPRWRMAFGALWGLAAATKFTGWFAGVGPALWVFGNAVDGLLRDSQRRSPSSGERRAVAQGMWALATALPVAALVLVAVQPAWWFTPISSVHRFLLSNLTRSETKPIPTLYLGKVHAFALPWHNTLVLTVVTTPVVFLGLGLLGIAIVVARRREEPWALIWPSSWLVLMLIRALPIAPGHDGIRLLLPSIASLAVLSGFGAEWLLRRLRPNRMAWIAPLAVTIGLGESLVGMAQTYPYTDSYFSAVIGGLPGAERLGFELTYYYDTLGNEFLDWVRRESEQRPVALRTPTPVVTLLYLRRWGLLPHEVKLLGVDQVSTDDLVLQRRRGTYYPWHWWLERYGHPEFVIRRQGVDLLRVYPYSEHIRAYEATKEVPFPTYLTQ